MSTFIVGTMTTTSGFETKSPTEALSRHLTYYFQSRYSQGKILGNVPSFYYLIKTYGENKERLVEETKLELTSYIKELFPTVVVTTSTEDLTGVNSQYKLKIGANIVSDGVSYDLAAVILITGELYKLLDIARLG